MIREIDVVKIFKESFPKMYEDMKNCEHGYQNQKNNPYHLEGDVWTHTMMVMDELKKFKYELNEIEYFTLQIAVLFHDSGKPYVWEENDEKKKRYFMGHWGRSFYNVCDLLENNPFGYGDVFIPMIAILVLNHHRRYESKFSNYNADLFTKLLNILSTCDSNGRLNNGDDENDILEELELNESIFKTTDESKPTISFLIGLPNVGKSTYVKDEKIEKVLSRDAIILELADTDNYNEAWESVNHSKVDKILNQRYQQFIKEREDFTIDMTNMVKKKRKKYMNDNFNSKGILFFTGYEEIMKRNKKRENKFIPEPVFKSMIKSFNLSFDEEFDDMDYIF